MILSELDQTIKSGDWSKAKFAKALLDMRIVETPLFNETAEEYAKARKPGRRSVLWRALRTPAEIADQPISRYDDNCQLYCRVCDYDDHFCGGCGTPTAHGINSCYQCCQEMGNEFLPLTWDSERLQCSYRGSSLTRFNTAVSS